MNKDLLVKGLTATGFAYGVGALAAPGALQRVYGTPETTPELRVMTRMWGTALLTISAATMRARGRDRDALLLAVGLSNLVDAAGSAAAARDGLSPKVAALGAVSSAGVAAVALYARSLD